MSDACKCGKPRHNAFLCPRCTKRLADELGRLAGLIPVLESVAARERCAEVKTFTKHRKWTPGEHGLAYNEQAGDAIREAYMCATAAASACVTGFMLPEPSTRKIVGMLRIAAERAEVIARERDADTILDDVIDTLQAAERAIDPVREDYGDADAETALSVYVSVADAINLARLFEKVEVSSTTAYRWIDEGKLSHRKERGRYQVMGWSLVQCARGVAA